MKDAAFQDLVASIREAGEIRRGERKPSRETAFKPESVKAIRKKLA